MAKDQTGAMRPIPVALAPADMEPQHGQTGRHGQDVKSGRQSFRGVLDSVKWELCEQAIQQGFEGMEESNAFTPVEVLKDRRMATWLH